MNAMNGYYYDLISLIPHYIYVLMAMALFCGAILILYTGKIRKKMMWLSTLVFVVYIYFLLGITVLYRNTNGFSKYWYLDRYTWNNGSLLSSEGIMNIVMFVPVGLLLGFIIRGMNWWRAVLAGFLLSVAIETLQFVSNKGFFDLDDIFHNTLGCMFGYGMFRLIQLMSNVKKKRYEYR